MQFVTSSEVHPLELRYCCCHYICYNAVLLEEALWPAHMSVCVCVGGGSFVILGASQSYLKEYLYINLVKKERHSRTDLCGLRPLVLTTPSCGEVSCSARLVAAVLQWLYTHNEAASRWQNEKDFFFFFFLCACSCFDSFSVFFLMIWSFIMVVEETVRL